MAEDDTNMFVISSAIGRAVLGVHPRWLAWSMQVQQDVYSKVFTGDVIFFPDPGSLSVETDGISDAVAEACKSINCRVRQIDVSASPSKVTVRVSVDNGQ